MLSLFACSMQCLCLPLLLQVNLPHGLNLLTVCERERERDSERKKEREKRRKRDREKGEADRRCLQFALAVHFLASK